MKRTLLTFIVAFFTFLSVAESYPSPQPNQAKISVYPNPASDFISINRDENVKQLAVFNLVGRKIKSFDNVVKLQQYDISDLPNGMYLIQVQDAAGKIITTQRISKR